jgi:hypothetical protein
MHGLTCVRCGTVYTADREKGWGRTKGSDGYGPTPRCTELVPAPYAPKTPGGEVPLQVCGGTLAAEHIDESTDTGRARAANVRLEEPITTRRG